MLKIYTFLPNGKHIFHNSLINSRNLRTWNILFITSRENKHWIKSHCLNPKPLYTSRNEGFDENIVSTSWKKMLLLTGIPSKPKKWFQITGIMLFFKNWLTVRISVDRKTASIWIIVRKKLKKTVSASRNNISFKNIGLLLIIIMV